MRIPSVVLLILLCAAGIARAQPVTTSGTDFWVTFMENSSLPTRTLFVSAQQPSVVTVSLGGQVVANVNVAANGSERIEITDLRIYQSRSDEICQNCAVRVQSTTPVSVYAYNSVNSSTDATIVLPVSALGDRYVIAAYQHYVVKSLNWASMFSIVGVQPNTVVEVTPKVAVSSPTLGSRRARVPFQVTLNAGDVVKFMSIVTNEDLTGSSVKVISSGDACGKVAVFSGHQRTAIPIDNDNNRDHLFEHLPPVRTLGKEYIVPPLRQAVRYNLRVVCSEPKTAVTINGVSVNVDSAGTFVERLDMDATRYHTVETSKPAMVVLYAQSSPVGWRERDGVGDPFMIVLPAVSQRIDKATIFAFVPNQQPGWADNTFVTLITPTEGLSRVRYDGYELNDFPAALGTIETVGSVGEEYSVVILRLRPGVHTFDASENNGLLALIHGLAAFDSYGFVAGASAANLRGAIIAQNQPFCPGKPIQFRGVNLDSQNVLSWRWIFHDGKTADGQETSRAYADTGTYQVKLVMPRSDCGADTAMTTIRVTTPYRLQMNVAPLRACADSTVVVTTTLQPRASNVRYIWRALDENGIVSAADAAEVHIRHARPGIYRYVLTASDEGGCTVQDTARISIISPPSITVNDRYLVCEGDDVQIPAAVSDPASTTIRWAADGPGAGVAIIGDATSAILKLRARKAGDYAFTLTVTNSIGCTQRKRVLVTVVAPPTVASSSGGNVYACLDESIPPVEIGGDIIVTGGVPPYQYAWSEQGGGTTSFRGSTSTLITQVKPKETTTYVLTVRDANGLIKCPAVIQVTVVMRPVPDAKAGDDAVLCACNQGSSATLGIDARCGQPPFRYSWSPTIGLSNPQSTVTAVTQARPTVTTSYILSVADATGTVNYDTVVVRVEPCPEVVVAQPVPQCGNDTTYALSASIRNGVANVTYAWEPATYLDDPSSPRPTARIPYGNTVLTYTLAARSPLGCVGMDSVTLRHSAGPGLALTSSHACTTDALCRGDNATMNVAVTGGVAPYTLRWTSVPELTPGWTSSASSIQVQPLQTTMFIVRATDSLGCQVTDSVRVCVDPVPNVRIGTDTIICASDVGSSRIVRGSPSTCGKPPFLYQWDPAALATVPDPSRPWEAVLSPFQSATFTLKVTDDGGRGVSTVDSMRVTVRETLRLALQPDSLVYCPSNLPDAVTLRPGNGTGPYVVQMFNNGVLLDEQQTVDSVLLRPDLLPTVVGTHTIHIAIVDANGCRMSDSLNIRVFEPPTVSIDAEQQICLCDSVSIRATGVSRSGGPLRFLWSESSEDAPIGTKTILSDTAAVQRVSPKRQTTYTVVAIDEYGCSSRASFSVDVQTTLPGMMLGIDSLVANPKAQNVVIPVVMSTASDSGSCPADAVQFDLRYNESLYDPFPRVEPGIVTANTTKLDTNGITWRTITVYVPASPTLRNGDVLCRIHGRALIGAPGQTLLDVDRVRMVYGCDDVAANASDGSLTLDSLCVTQDSVERLLDFNTDAILSIFPNPVTQGVIQVELYRASADAQALAVTDLAGRIIAIHPVTGKVGERFIQSIVTPDVPGMYQVMLKSSTGTSGRVFIVRKD